MSDGGFLVDWSRRHDLLTADEEINLSREIQAWLAIRDQASFSKAEAGICLRGKKAQDRMIHANLRLVARVAFKYRARLRHSAGLCVDDIMQEGVLGLRSATEKFDPERGYKFSTYAYWWIRQGINRGIEYYQRVIRLPIGADSQLFRARSLMEDAIRSNAPTPTMSELAEACHVSEARLRGYMPFIKDAVSLDMACTGGDSSSSLLDMQADEGVDAWQEVENSERLETAHKLISTLDDTAQDVIRRCFGIGTPPQQLHEIGADLGISRHNVSKIKKEALERLRSTCAVA